LTASPARRSSFPLCRNTLYIVIGMTID
jgi:hypothetical protein